MSLPTEPYSRIERYLAKLAGQDVDIPDRPITRIECYLDYIVNNGGGVPAANAGAHNGIYRGMALGNTFTSDQRAAIQAGTFDDLFIGDYWEMPWGEGDTPPLVKFRIAGFDYFMNNGDPPAVTAHHAVILPDTNLGASVFHSEAEGDYTAGGYYTSYVRETSVAGMVAPLEELFGTLVQYSLRVPSSLTASAPIRSKADLMTGIMAAGLRFNSQSFASLNAMYPFPLFALKPEHVISTGDYWLEDGFAANSAMVITATGRSSAAGLTTSSGVRPFFCIG